MNEIELTTTIQQAIYQYGKNTSRSQQSNEGRLGPSDIGFCRQKAVLMTNGVAPTDDTSIWSAQVGTAIHAYLAEMAKEMFPTWLLEQEVTAELPSGVTLTGSCDAIVPEWNAVLDWKTVNGTSWAKRNGTSQNHKYQRHLYAMGAVQAGLLDDSKPVYVGNVYLDRSGADPTPHIVIEEFDPTLTDEIDLWLEDVIYAVKHGEAASRDVAPVICAQICDRFTACRGGMLPVEEGDWLESPEIDNAVNMYLEAKSMEREAKKMRAEASAALAGIEGRTRDFQIRWVTVGPSEVQAMTRAGYTRLDIVKVKKQA